MHQHPFRVVESKLSNYSEVGFHITAKGHPPIITPEQVGTQVLKYLLKLTADYLGHKQVNKAVIAVPAKFNSVQRQATGEAYKQAGLKVIRVIEEPTAAAVAYQLHKKSNIHHILVYDFGGGTLDVSLLYVSKGSVQVYATDGDELLGGSDFDHCLFNHIKHKLISEHGVDVTSFTIEQMAHLDEKMLPYHPVDGSSIPYCDVPSVLQEAEEVKKQFSNATEVDFYCVHPLTAAVLHLPLLKERDFEVQCGHLFERGILPVTRLLHDLEMTPEDVDEVVLVGGTTRVPKVKQLLRDYFHKPLNDHIDPDITVAYGAASIID